MPKYCYTHPRPSLAADCAVFGFDGQVVKILLIQRKRAPFKGDWALPGGFVNMDEDLNTAAARELAEETSLIGVALEQFQTFGTPGRDPRGRTISVAYHGVVHLAETHAKADDDAAAVDWFPVNKLPKLAFDHAIVIPIALDHFRLRLRHQSIAFDLLPPKFTLSQLQNLFEAALETKLDKRNFRKKTIAQKVLTPVTGERTAGPYRPAQLYAFDRKNYARLKKQGVHLEF